MNTTKLRAPSRLAYYAVDKYWRRLAPLYRSAAARRIWLPDMRDFRVVRLDEHGIIAGRDDRHYRTPSDFDSSTWRFDSKFMDANARSGNPPAYWDYVCHSACHWLINLNAWVITQVEPDRDWRVVTSPQHSTVWDGRHTLFDLNFLALGVSTAKAWALAANHRDTMVYAIHRGWNARVPGQRGISEPRRFLPTGYYGRGRGCDSHFQVPNVLSLLQDVRRAG